jgi:hypothetical protein
MESLMTNEVSRPGEGGSTWAEICEGREDWGERPI